MTIKKPQLAGFINRLGLAVLAILVLCGAYVFGKYFTIGLQAAEPVSVRPYILDLKQIDYSKNPEGVVFLNQLTMRRRDGADALVLYTPGHPGQVVGRRINGIDGRVAGVFDSISSVMSGWITPRALAQKKKALVAPPARCAWKGEIAEAEEAVLGRRAWRVLREAPGSGKRVFEWRLPDFACAMMQRSHFEKQSDGSWRKVAEAVPISFVEADPDPGVFSDWSAYAELPPSEIRKRLYQRAGIGPEVCKECSPGEIDSDMRYFNSQQRP